MTELEGRVALARIEVEKARLLADAALAVLKPLRLAGGTECAAAALAHALAVQDVKAAEVRLAVAESALARSLT